MTSMQAYLANEVRLMLYRQRRYLLEFVLSSGFLLAVFAGLAWGIRVIPDAEATVVPLDVMATGFVAWGFANAAYAGISNEISDEIRSRSLEQLFLSPAPLWRVLLRRAVVHLLSALLSSLALFHVCLYIAGKPVEINVLHTAAVLLLAAPALLGLGYLIAGINLVFKQVDTVNAIMVIAFIVLVSVPAYPISALSLLPFSYAASLLMATKASLQLSATDAAVIAGNASVYFVAGLAVFIRCQAVAVGRGTLSHA